MKEEEWNRLVQEGLTTGGVTNIRYDFKKMCKKFGRSYIAYLKIAYEARGDMRNDEFIRLNGSLPL